MASADERRRAARAPLDTWVELVWERRRRRGVACDVSVGGLGIAQGADGLPPGRWIVAEFPLPGISLPVALEGVVVWSRPPDGRGGVRFVGVDAGLAELLARYASGALGD